MERVFYCYKCQRDEWCSVTDLGDYYLANAFVCGSNAKIPKLDLDIK